MNGFVRIVITDDVNGNPGCPHDTVGDVELPPPGVIPEVWPYQQCVRCGAWLLDLYPELVPAAVEGLRRAYPGCSVIS